MPAYVWPNTCFTDVMIEGNRFHEHLANAGDIKTCNFVTIRANKLYSYSPSPIPRLGD